MRFCGVKLKEISVKYARALVLDTSFLIARAQGHYWTFEPFDLLKNQNSAVVIPEGVDREFKNLMKDRTRQIEAPNRDDMDIFGVLKQEDFVSYDAELQETLAQRLEHEPEYYGNRHKPLSHVDKTIIQATLDVVDGGIPVAVVSGDEGIINQVQEINLRDRLDIENYSPWRAPIAQDGVRLLLTEEAYHQLSVMQIDSHRKYFVVAKDMDIGSGVIYDIAFAIYANVNNALVFPRVNNANFLKIYQYGMDNPKNLGLLTLAMIPFYFRVSNNLNLTVNNNPLTQKEYGMISSRKKGRRLKSSDIKRLSSATSDLEHVKWGIISIDDIRRHNALTAGKLEGLVRKLSATI
jgi:rRNA-processing protein FCF1